MKYMEENKHIKISLKTVIIILSIIIFLIILIYNKDDLRNSLDGILSFDNCSFTHTQSITV